MGARPVHGRLRFRALAVSLLYAHLRRDADQLGAIDNRAGTCFVITLSLTGAVEVAVLTPISGQIRNDLTAISIVPFDKAPIARLAAEAVQLSCVAIFAHDSLAARSSATTEASGATPLRG